MQDQRFNTIVTDSLLFCIYYNVLKEEGVPQWVTFLVATGVVTFIVVIAHLATRTRKP